MTTIISTRLKEISPIQIGPKQPESYTGKLLVKCEREVTTYSPTRSRAINILARLTLATLISVLLPVLVPATIIADGARIIAGFINRNLRITSKNKMQKLIDKVAKYIISKKYYVASAVALMAILGLGYANNKALLRAARNTRVYRYFYPQKPFYKTNSAIGTLAIFVLVVIALSANQQTQCCSRISSSEGKKSKDTQSSGWRQRLLSFFQKNK